MVASGYGTSHPTGRGESVASVLIAYGQRGGALYAAYRLPDNPLVLSNVRWQGSAGEVIEAQHSPEDAYDLPQEEREAWAQIALGSTTTQPDAFGPNAPWLLVSLDRRYALDLGLRARDARIASPSYPHNSTPHHSGAPNPFSNAPSSGHSSYGSSFGVPSANQLPHAPMPGYARHAPTPHMDEYPTSRMIESLSGNPSSMPESPQNTGQWAREDLMRSSYPPQGQPAQQEVTVIPCVEVEMPVLMAGDAQDFTRDFARDVAIHFNRAARSIPQARELRGWMRGARIVLAVRMGFGPGARPANRAEMEHAASLLAEALTRRTLPYAQLRFAEPAEWSQGVELPNS